MSRCRLAERSRCRDALSITFFVVAADVINTVISFCLTPGLAASVGP